MAWHYPPVAGFSPRAPRGQSEQLFSDAVLDQQRPGVRLKTRRPKAPAGEPTTLCGMTSRQPTRSSGYIDCDACRKLLERYPQLGNRLEQAG